MIKNLIALFIVVLCSFTMSFSQTKIKLQNNTSAIISAAYAKYLDDGSGWTSYGWWNINPGESKIIDLANYNYTNVYIYGFYKSTNWGSGNYQFCVDYKKAFTFTNADNDCDYTKKTFSEFKITLGKINTWNFNPSKNTTVNNNSNQVKVSSKKIDIYTLAGCGICTKSIQYMNQHNIKYTEYPTEKDENMNAMFSLLCKSGCSANTEITGPVFVVDGKVYYNIKNLDDFLSKL